MISFIHFITGQFILILIGNDKVLIKNVERKLFVLLVD